MTGRSAAPFKLEDKNKSEISTNHQRSLSASSYNKSDSGQSLDCKEQKHGHYRSKSGVQERQWIDSGQGVHQILQL